MSKLPLCGVMPQQITCVCAYAHVGCCFFCSDVKSAGVSVIHREQLHKALREKQSCEKVHVGENTAKAKLISKWPLLGR